MLCLTLRFGEEVKVGDMLIKVSKMGGSRVTLAFEGPREIHIARVGRGSQPKVDRPRPKVTNRHRSRRS